MNEYWDQIEIYRTGLIRSDKMNQDQRALVHQVTFSFEFNCVILQLNQRH
jgi:hypothetical protein